MPAFLLSPTFWKFFGAAIVIAIISIAIVTFVNHYKYLQTQAALVPVLQKANAGLISEINTKDTQAGADAKKLAAAYAERDRALADFAAFQSLAGRVDNTLKGLAARANATTNPVCLPTDAERILFNSTVAEYFAGHSGDGSAPPGGPVPSDAR